MRDVNDMTTLRIKIRNLKPNLMRTYHKHANVLKDYFENKSAASPSFLCSNKRPLSLSCTIHVLSFCLYGAKRIQIKMTGIRDAV